MIFPEPYSNYCYCYYCYYKQLVLLRPPLLALSWFWMSATFAASEGEGVKMPVVDVKHIVFGECGLDCMSSDSFTGKA